MGNAQNEFMAGGYVVDNYTPCVSKESQEVNGGLVPVDAAFNEMLHLNRQAVYAGYVDGTLPRYPEFVDNLFKNMAMLWPADVTKVIDDYVMELSQAGVEPTMAAYALKNRLKSLLTPDGSMMHAAIGCAGEGGELLDAVKKVFIYRKDWNAVDKTGQSPLANVLEELGDFRFYYQALLNLLDLNDSDVIAHNYAKLRTRYASGKYSDQQAQARADKAPPAVLSPGPTGVETAEYLAAIPPAVEPAVLAVHAHVDDVACSGCGGAAVVGGWATNALAEMEKQRTQFMQDETAWVAKRAALIEEFTNDINSLSDVEKKRVVAGEIALRTGVVAVK